MVDHPSIPILLLCGISYFIKKCVKKQKNNLLRYNKFYMRTIIELSISTCENEITSSRNTIRLFRTHDAHF